jgi:putative endonuclease
MKNRCAIILCCDTHERIVTVTTLGQRGEDAALSYLQAQGYTLLARNWRCAYGELDLVMQQHGQLVFVEVKARRSLTPDDALAGLTAAKLSRLTTAIYHYLDAHQLPADGWRLDVVGVALNGDRASIQHVENCLDW